MIDQPQCHMRKCTHFLGVKSDPPGPETNERPYCLAFPDGIPTDIAYGDDLHLKPKKDQGNTIAFKKDDEV